MEGGRILHIFFVFSSTLATDGLVSVKLQTDQSFPHKNKEGFTLKKKSD
jgi:hypothetical protein